MSQENNDADKKHKGEENLNRGGRPKGAVNKNTLHVRELARTYGAGAIARLAYLMEFAESEQAQIAAAKELLDRGFGKSVQAIETSGPDGGPIQISQIQLVSLTPDE